MAERGYTVTGTQPVRKPGTKSYAEPGETFRADPKEVKFLVDTGAISETPSASVKTARKSKKR